MAERIPKRYPVYTIDPEGRIREYLGPDAWSFFRRKSERRIWKKDLPKGSAVYKSYDDYDV